MDYDVALSLEKCWKSKVLSSITVNFRGGISEFTVLGPWTTTPILVYIE